MNIFSEIYGAYYRTVQRILCLDSITESSIYNAVSEEAFADSALFIPRKLIPKNGVSDWGMLKEKGDKSFASVLKSRPSAIVTALQKRWLKAQLADPKFRLFIPDIKALEERLEDVMPLYRQDMFRITDVFTDGDPYEDENYIKNFRTVVNAIRSGSGLDVEFMSGKNERKHGRFLPLRLEYSRKNDKFRVYCIPCTGRNRSGGLINLGRIISAEDTGCYEGKCDLEEYFLSRRCREPVTVEVSSERNGIERFMMEFAAYEKYTERDLKTGKCTVKLWYDSADETEMLIRLLSYGPVLEIISPPSLRKQAAERVLKQAEFIRGAAMIS